MDNGFLGKQLVKTKKALKILEDISKSIDNQKERLFTSSENALDDNLKIEGYFQVLDAVEQSTNNIIGILEDDIIEVIESELQ